MQEHDALIKERFNELPKELRDYIVSEEFSRKFGLIARKYRLNEEHVRLVENEIFWVLVVFESVDNLHIRFEEVGFPQETAANLALDVTDYLLKKVDEYLAMTKEDLIVQEEGVAQPEIQTSAQSTTSPIKPIVGAHKLKPIFPHIENAPKRITDTSHLIDDTVDERPKLQDHYTD